MGTPVTRTYRIRLGSVNNDWSAWAGALGANLTISGTGGLPPLGWGGAYLPGGTIRGLPATAGDAWPGSYTNVQVAINGGAWIDLATGLLYHLEGPPLEEQAFALEPLTRIVERTRVRLALLENRPIATKTTASSDEDGTSAGLLNRLFRACGGRPVEQIGTYLNAPFHYRCAASSVAVPYAALDTDNAWTTALELAQAAGGQIVQDGAGVLSFGAALAYGTPGSSTALAGGRISRVTDYGAVVGKLIAPFTRVVRLVEQDVYDGERGAALAGGETRDFDLAMQRPVARYAGHTVASSQGGEPASPTVTPLGSSAMSYRLRIVNPSATEPLLIERVVIRGDPVANVGEGVATWDGGAAGELRLPSNRFVQTLGTAERWARMAGRALSILRAAYTVSDLPFGAGLMPGSTVTHPAIVSGASLRVVDGSYAQSGAACRLTVIPLTDLLSSADVWRVGAVYADGDTRQWGY